MKLSVRHGIDNRFIYLSHELTRVL